MWFDVSVLVVQNVNNAFGRNTFIRMTLGKGALCKEVSLTVSTAMV